MQKNLIDVDSSINSGQVFLWKKYDEIWYGINGQNILKIDKFGEINSKSGDDKDFLRKTDNVKKILDSISKDATIKDAIKKYPGLRILRQDPFQCMISFIVSSNSNIQKIKLNLENISEKFGEKTCFDKINFQLFPKPKKLANATIKEITECGVGYRAEFIKECAEMVNSKEIDFENLKKSTYTQAKDEIMKISGIGNKVADCILLFSLEKLEAFPLDRWMIRILEKYYSNEFAMETKTITEKQYKVIHEKILNHFGEYAGYAQQFLFKMERENYQKRWL